MLQQLWQKSYALMHNNRVTALNDGEAKFRANDAWDDSWGGKAAFQRIQEIISLSYEV
jgi:hypothetical protein